MNININSDLLLICILVGIFIMYINAPEPEILIKYPGENKNKKCFCL